jgi:hypothetical protein
MCVREGQGKKVKKQNDLTSKSPNNPPLGKGDFFITLKWEAGMIDESLPFPKGGQEG